MSEEIKVSGIDVKIPDSVDTAVENLIGPSTKGIGQTMGDLWFLALGGISHLADKRRAKYALALERFKEKLADDLNAVPEQKRIEANTQIVMNALQDAQSCVEEEVLRGMFAKLIASSTDEDLSGNIHPSFSNIIKYMSPQEASILAKLKRYGHLPMVGFVLRDPIKQVETYTGRYITSSGGISNPFEQQASVEALIAYGLVEADFIYKVSVHRGAPYDYSEFDPMYKMFAEVSDRTSPSNTRRELTMRKGGIRCTQLGNRFLVACVP